MDVLLQQKVITEKEQTIVEQLLPCISPRQAICKRKQAGALEHMTMIPVSFKIHRGIETGFHRLKEVFTGLDDSPALARLFDSRKDLEKFLEGVMLRIAKSDGYMYVDPWDGSVVVNWRYLVEGANRDLYLDIIHELIHVRQWIQGKDLYDRRFSYAERPTEHEAYSIVVGEAKRIGMNRKEILEYLEVPWISRKDLQLMADQLGIGI
jgi:hypothetical protein